jgi:hypothetical protein
VLLTRRTFMQSSLVASLSVVAEATCGTWLLRPNDPVRIAVAGLGPTAAEHLSLYAAIPGVEVVGLADPSITRLREAVAKLERLGQVTPRVFTRLDALMSIPAIHAISAPHDESGHGFSLTQLLDIGLPVLTDVPPPLFSYRDFLRLKQARVAVRSSDFIYPGALSDIHARWNRIPAHSALGIGAHANKLVLERRLTSAQLRAVLISALRAVLDSKSSRSDHLDSWTNAADAIELTRACTVARIHLPAKISRFNKIDFDLLPRSSGASLLSLDYRTQTIATPVWRTPDGESSLHTVMNFLGEVRSPRNVIVTNEAGLSFAAATIIDRVLCLLQSKR